MFYRIIFCIECHVINTNIVKYYSIYYELNWFGLMASKTTSFKFCRLGPTSKIAIYCGFLGNSTKAFKFFTVTQKLVPQQSVWFTLLYTSDPCRGKSNQYTYSFDGNCRAYWECNNGVSLGRCCPRGQSYIQGIGCSWHQTCNETCWDHEVKEGRSF